MNVQDSESGGPVSAYESVRLGDLPRERETDSRAIGLGRVERHEQIRGVGEAGALVADPHIELAVPRFPADLDRTRVERRVHRVPHEVDEQLIELSAIRLDRHVRTSADRDRPARLQRDDAAHPVLNRYALEPGWRQARQSGVRRHQAAERF